MSIARNTGYRDLLVELEGGRILSLVYRVDREQAFSKERFHMGPGQIVYQKAPEENSDDPTGYQTGGQRAYRSEYGEYAEDHSKGQGPSFSMQESETGSQPDETKEEKEPTDDQPNCTDQ